jgi:hypothetical protein
MLQLYIPSSLASHLRISSEMDYEYDLPSSTNLFFLGGILVYSSKIHLSQISHSKTSLQKFRVEV